MDLDTRFGLTGIGLTVIATLIWTLYAYRKGLF